MTAPPTHPPRRSAVDRIVGVAAGTATAATAIGTLLVAAVLRAAGRLGTSDHNARARRRAHDLIESWLRTECRRLQRSGVPCELPPDRPPAAYAVAHGVVGTVMGSAVVVGTVVGAGYLVVSPSLWAAGEIPLLTALVSTGVGIAALLLVVQCVIAAGVVDTWLAGRLIGPSRQELLERRIEQLDTARARIVAAVDDERRRIERDLHDGVQQRVVALAMLLGQARRTTDTDRAAALQERAHDEAQRVVRDLRDVAWRVYPAALGAGGLGAALGAVADRSTLPVHVRCDLPDRPAPSTETAAYFVVCEAVTNAVKHARPASVDVQVRADGDTLVVEVSDDGCGGADIDGSGLTGLARRLEALDGTLLVDSPPGGPTVVRAELPCG